MKKPAINMTSYPPPPPPPPPPSPKNASKTLIAVIAVVLVVAAVVGAYYVMTQTANNGGLKPSASPTPSITSPASSANPSAAPTPSTHISASPTSALSTTPTSSPSELSHAGYRVGAWANYILKNYDGNGTVTNQFLVSYSVDQTTFNGIDSWLLKNEMSFSTNYSLTKTTTTYWLDKSTLQGLHYKIQIASNGVVISDTENDYQPGDVNNIPTAIDPNVVVGKETITVPAGTFNCDKTTATTTDLGTTYVTSTWGNTNVPVVGMVKQQITAGDALISVTELMAYGS